MSFCNLNKREKMSKMTFGKVNLVNFISANIRNRLSDPEDKCFDVRFEEIEKAIKDLDLFQRCLVFAQYGWDSINEKKDLNDFEALTGLDAIERSLEMTIPIGIKKAREEIQFANSGGKTMEDFLEHILKMWIPYAEDL